MSDMSLNVHDFSSVGCLFNAWRTVRYVQDEDHMPLRKSTETEDGTERYMKKMQK
jgi:hypothetical protein